MLDNATRGLVALVSALMLAINDRVPEVRARKAISTLITIILIVVIIGAGVAIIFVLVLFPGAPTTTTYP